MAKAICNRFTYTPVIWSLALVLNVILLCVYVLSYLMYGIDGLTASYHPSWYIIFLQIISITAKVVCSISNSVKVKPLLMVGFDVFISLIVICSLWTAASKPLKIIQRAMDFTVRDDRLQMVQLLPPKEIKEHCYDNSVQQIGSYHYDIALFSSSADLEDFDISSASDSDDKYCRFRAANNALNGLLYYLQAQCLKEIEGGRKNVILTIMSEFKCFHDSLWTVPWYFDYILTVYDPRHLVNHQHEYTHTQSQSQSQSRLLLNNVDPHRQTQSAESHPPFIRCKATFCQNEKEYYPTNSQFYQLFYIIIALISIITNILYYQTKRVFSIMMIKPEGLCMTKFNCGRSMYSVRID